MNALICFEHFIFIGTVCPLFVFLDATVATWGYDQQVSQQKTHKKNTKENKFLPQDKL